MASSSASWPSSASGVPTPLSLASKWSLSKRIYSAIRRQTSCPICLAAIESRSAALLSTCLHVYCYRCIRTWSDVKRSCPLCKESLVGLYVNIRLSTGDFDRVRLPSLKERNQNQSQDRSSEPRSVGIDHFSSRRFMADTRERLFNSIRRSRPLPQRRSFKKSRFVPSIGSRSEKDLMAERVLLWRASIYKQHLQAVPVHFSSRNDLSQNVGNNDVKERLRQRLEPWVKRELHAILGDLDLTLIVHLATSLWMLCCEERLKLPSLSGFGEDEYAQQLKPFLGNHANAFWHELSCFAESSLTVEAYDSVVGYKPAG